MTTAPANRISANYYLAPAGTGIGQFMGWAKAAGASGIGLTIAALSQHNPDELKTMAADHGLFISTLNSAGYFLYPPGDQRYLQDKLNCSLIDAAARMGAGRLVVIAGGTQGSGLTLEAARASVAEQLGALDKKAAEAGIRLALEPIHPVDLLIKGCVNSLAQAAEMVRSLPSTDVMIDTIHSAWDPDIWRLPQVLGDKLAVVQVCNWYEPSPEEKPLRDVPSTGEMDMAGWLRALLAGGYTGPIEFEMFDKHRRDRGVQDILDEAIGDLRAMVS
jgi:sugar phosphate isomerase/epimerase